MRILVDIPVERLCVSVIEMLVATGHDVERGNSLVRGERFDIVVVSSADLAERLRRDRPGQAIIAVTRVGDVAARVRALDAGADDAFDTGFSMSQVGARVGAVGRRAAVVPRDPERIVIDGCTLDLSACTACRDGDTVNLTPRELELVRWLVRHAGRVVTRGELLEHVWGVSPHNATRAVDVAVAGLRAKLERDPGNPVILVSVKGTGYRWG